MGTISKKYSYSGSIFDACKEGLLTARVIKWGEIIYKDSDIYSLITLSFCHDIDCCSKHWEHAQVRHHQQCVPHKVLLFPTWESCAVFCFQIHM